MAIAECKVNGNVELDLTTSKHILKECIPLVEGKGLEGDFSIFAPKSSFSGSMGA